METWKKFVDEKTFDTEAVVTILFPAIEVGGVSEVSEDLHFLLCVFSDFLLIDAAEYSL